MFIKRGEGKILDIIESEELDDKSKKKAEKISQSANQDEKSLSKDKQCS
jgi:hypothetical protein